MAPAENNGRWDEAVYARPPMKWRDGIPVFSKEDEYVANYERISADHLQAYHKTGRNPFITEALWQECELTTVNAVGARLRPGDRILDVGVGMGRLLEKFPGISRYGMDISHGYLDIARAKGIEVCYARVEDMPYRAETFDIVTCTDVLEHVFDLSLCCRKILSVLKPGGFLIVRVPNLEDLSRYTEPDFPYQYCHLRILDEASLRLLFERILGDCRVEEATLTGFVPRSFRLLYRTPAIMINRMVSVIMRGIAVYPPLYQYLIRRLYQAIEVNVVVRKIASETYKPTDVTC